MVFWLASAFVALTLTSSTAAADQTIVSATIYPGAQGTIANRSVGLDTLNGCTPYAGANPIWLYGPGQPIPEQLPADTTWSLATVLTCGFGLPLGQVTGVQVAKGQADQGFDATLSSARLSDPSQFNDPRSPDALPVVSTDANEDINTYVRPWLGGTDNNAAEMVTQQNAPLTIAVFENGQPLSVHASQQSVSGTSTTTTIQFRAAVQTASGAAVAASALKWSWSFGDGGSSSAPTPTHPFAAGQYPVTVQVTDASAGSAGTDTIEAIAHTTAATGAHQRSGGSKTTKSKSPVGPDRSSGNHAGGHSGATKGSSTGATSASDAAAATTAPVDHGRQHPSGNGAKSSTSAATKRPARAAKTPHPAPRPAPSAVARAAAEPLVTGRLISDVSPLPPGASPLLRDAQSTSAAAPHVRQATRVSLLPILGSGLAIVVLLGLGAGRELRWRDDWRGLRFGR